MGNARWDEAEAGIKITGRNINNLRYADDTTLMAENEVELKSLLTKVKEETEITQRQQTCVQDYEMLNNASWRKGKANIVYIWHLESGTDGPI